MTQDFSHSIIKDHFKFAIANLEYLQQEFFELNKDFEEILNLISNVKGKTIFTGVGKSGILAHKCASTMASLGKPSCFLHAAEAGHGDLGMIHADDLIILISKTGASDELKYIFEYTQRSGIPLISVVNMNPIDRVKNNSTYILQIPILGENNDYNAPIYSTLSSILVLDIISLIMANQNSFTNNDYGRNHPSGKLGKNLQKVGEIMIPLKDLPISNPEIKLYDAVQIMSRGKIGCVIIVNKQSHLKGIFTDGDLRRILKKYSNKLDNLALQDVMNSSPLTLEDTNLTLSQCQEIFQEYRINQLLFVQESKLIGCLPIMKIL